MVRGSAFRGPCRDCDREMVVESRWSTMTREEREGRARHGAGDRCHGCKCRHLKAAKPTPVTGPDIQPLPSVREPLTGQRRSAALAVCSMAADATEAAAVLDMLGLLEPARRTPVEDALGDDLPEPFTGGES